MKWTLRRERGISHATSGLLGALVVLGLIVIMRELPAMRRYLRMERM
jgi:hypothetical protein